MSASLCINAWDLRARRTVDAPARVRIRTWKVRLLYLRHRVRMFRDRSAWQPRLKVRQFSDRLLIRDQPNCVL
jgi:hypothetical protein